MAVQRVDSALPSTKLIRGAIIASVLLISVVLALKATDQILTLFLIALAGFAGAGIIAGNSVFAVVMIIPVSVFLGFGLTVGSSASAGANLLLIGFLTILWLAKSMLNRSVAIFPRSAPVAPLLALCAIAVLALAFGQVPWFSFAKQAPLEAQIGGLATFLFSAAAFFLAATQIRTVHGIRLLTWTFIIVAAIKIVIPTVSESLLPIPELTARGATGSLFWAWLAAMGFSQIAGNATLRKGVKVGLLVLMASIFQIHFFSQSSWVSGWLPALVAIGTIIWVRSPRMGAALTLTGGVAVIGAFPSLIGDLLASNAYSLTTRLEAWRIVGEIVRVNPVLGLGPANYYWYAPLFPILGFSVQFNSHNNYVDIVAQTGLLGLFAFLLFALAMFFLARRLLTVTDKGFERAYVMGVIGGLSGTLVAGMLGDWVIPFIYNVGLKGMRASLIGWLFMGGLVALEQTRRTPE